MDQQISGILKEREGAPLQYQDNLASFCQKHIELKVVSLHCCGAQCRKSSNELLP
jgi:hypothetical protein